MADEEKKPTIDPGAWGLKRRLVGDLPNLYGLSAADGSGIATSLLVDDPYSIFETPEQKKVREERDKYKKQAVDALKKAEDSDKNTEEYRKQLDAANSALAKFQRESSLKYLLSRVLPDAHGKILNDPLFAEKFNNKTSNAFVISIDVRNSTDLMLKASSPAAFAEFMSNLSTSLSDIMKSELCVLDKFTGDGMLGFFPEFYSGSDFGLHALRVAKRCHEKFGEVYENARGLFNTVSLETGLGIGIDYGDVQLLKVHDGLTVVGRPVVYACRLSGAPAGKTFVNQSAHNQLRKYAKDVRFDSSESVIKNEGRIAVWELVELRDCIPSEPEWRGS